MIRLASLSELVRGRLLNHPAVSGVERFVFEAARIRRGDCFIDTQGCPHRVGQAVKGGAYAVISAVSHPCRDQEVGWIEVASMERALSGLSRYLILERSVNLYSADRVVCALVDALMAGSGLLVEPSHQQLIVTLQREGPTPAVLLAHGHPHAQGASVSSAHYPLTILKEGLFETILDGGGRPVRLLLSSLFTPQLMQAVGLLESLGLRWRYPPSGLLGCAGRFEPLFLDARLRPVGFGCTARAAICDHGVPSVEIGSILNKMKQLAPWAHILHSDERDLKRLVSVLEREPFHYAYLSGVEHEQLAACLQSRVVQPSLPGLRADPI